MRTPYSTPKRMPLKPPSGVGSNAFTKSLSPPRSMITVMKKINRTAIEISASVSWTRVEIWTPKYRTANSRTANTTSHSQMGSGDSASKINGHKLSWT